MGAQAPSSPMHATAAAAIASIFCGRSREDPRLLRMIESLGKNPPVWEDGRGPVYWYLGTYAMFHHGGEEWLDWVEKLKKTLLDQQRMDGCADGSWDPTGPDGRKLGRAGVSALNCLSLEIYYRYARAQDAKPPENGGQQEK